MQAEHLKRGAAAEALAATHLERHGLTILARNVRCRGGEVDLIAEDKGSIVFVDPAVLVRVKCGEFEKSIAALRPEQFRSVVDFAIAVSVECEETAVARQEIYLFRLTVGIEVEFEALAGQLGG